MAQGNNLNINEPVRFLLADDVYLGRPTIINDGSSTSNSSEIEDVGTFQDKLAEEHPEREEVIYSLDPSEYSTAHDFLDALNDLITDSGEGEPVTVSETYTGTLYFDELLDVAIESTGSTQITIKVGEETILDNIYQPGFDGMIHMDLQDLVREHSAIFLPTAINGHESIIDGICHEYYAMLTLDIIVKIANVTKNYSLKVHAFEEAGLQRMSDIDAMDIPGDYLLPLSVPLRNSAAPSGTITAYIVDSSRNVVCNYGSVATGDGENEYPYAPIYAQDIPIGAVPYKKGYPFKVRLVNRYFLRHRLLNGQMARAERNDAISTPAFRVVNGQFEQYIFLNKYGHYDNVAMSGALAFTPEYEIENARRVYTTERAKGNKNNLWTQNTGPLTKATMKALTELMLSPVIYRYVPGVSLRRIVIETPELTISSRDSVHSGTFKWRYVENNA